MRSSKNRSRSKGNRNRSVGNIVNRVFDSSGPEGKVRGTPQQIIDKYNQLTRDAQLSNDRVAAENFQQHAEHYLRLLGEAQREMDARRDQQQGAQQGGQQGNGQQGGGQQGGGNQQGGGQGRGQSPTQGETGGQGEGGQGEERSFDAVVDTSSGGDGDSTLVETPENAPKPRRTRTRRPKKSEDEGGTSGGKGSKGDDAPKSGGDDPAQEAAE